jgi:hypothetical protein
VEDKNWKNVIYKEDCEYCDAYRRNYLYGDSGTSAISDRVKIPDWSDDRCWCPCCGKLLWNISRGEAYKHVKAYVERLLWFRKCELEENEKKTS